MNTPRAVDADPKFWIWVCLKMSCTPLYPMVLLIIIPFLNGYFIGNIPYFQTNPNSEYVNLGRKMSQSWVLFLCTLSSFTWWWKIHHWHPAMKLHRNFGDFPVPARMRPGQKWRHGLLAQRLPVTLVANEGRRHIQGAFIFSLYGHSNGKVMFSLAV